MVQNSLLKIQRGNARITKKNSVTSPQFSPENNNLKIKYAVYSPKWIVKETK
jgi:hypothetical protein